MSRMHHGAHRPDASRALTSVVWMAGIVLLAIALGAGAGAQTQAPAPPLSQSPAASAAPAPKADTAPAASQMDQLRANLETLSRRLATASQTIAQQSGAMTSEAREELRAMSQPLADARQQADALNLEPAASAAATEDQALHAILALTAAFVLISAIVVLVLSGRIRQAFYRLAATDADGGWRTYLMQLPLGAPEGSVRALLSMFVVIFGLLVLVMQKRLGLDNVDAVAGFVGIVITFYFTARTNDQAQKAVGAAMQTANDAANAAKDSAQKTADAMVGVARDMQTHSAAQVQSVIAALSLPPLSPPTAQPQPSTLGAAAPAEDDSARLRAMQSDLRLTRQVMGALKNSGVGPDLFSGANNLAGPTDQVLATIDKILQGGSDAPAAAAVAGAATRLLGQLGDVGLPGAFGGAVAVLGSVMKIAGPALSGLPLGPAGVVGGLVVGGLGLLADDQKFNAWKSALLAKPFDRSLLPPSVDDDTASIALELSPLMSNRLAGAAPAIATALLRACIVPAADGNPKSSADLAQELLASADPPGLSDRFASETELAEAIEEYRGSAIFARARDRIAGQIAIPALAGEPAATVDLGTLLTAAFKLSQDPRAASALEEIVYTVQALGTLHLDPGRLVTLVQLALRAGAAMAGTTRIAEDPLT
jgi:hypothetical protein